MRAKNRDVERTSEEQPLRAELFGIDQLQRHAKAIAGWHEVASVRARNLLLPRLAENEEVLLYAYGLVTEAAVSDRRVTPAAEWLLDNFYLIEDQIRMAKRHLPEPYSNELPSLRNGPRAGFPRVYDLAFELISHLDGSVDEETLAGFIAAYQTICPLNLGELWAIPIMLRLALLENLRRVASRLAAATIEKNNANFWADRMIVTAEKDPPSVIITLADMARTNPPMTSAFVAELARRLQGQSSSLAFPLQWIEQRLSDSGATIEHLVQIESQQQAADQVSIGNSIVSLRFVGSMDWREFVETMSLVEQTLRGDPANVYGEMDFDTRDKYRHVVEIIAKHSPLSEEQVAHQSIELARSAISRHGTEHRTAHVGYYLIDDGRRELERAAKTHFSVVGYTIRLSRKFPLAFYAGPIAIITGLIAWVLLDQLSRSGVSPIVIVLLAILPVLVASQLAVSIVNWLSTVVVKPHSLPRMDFSHGLPPDCRALIAIPTIIGSKHVVDELLEGLEIRFLANRDENLRFAILSDFQDAPQETMPDDAELLDRLRRGIEFLNKKYQIQEPDIGASDDAARASLALTPHRTPPPSSYFILLHRPRRWNEQEQLWLGWERKRGKLLQLNYLLRGGASEPFSLIAGDTSIFPSIKFVITLDSDTQLPRDSARRLVATIAHPLNRARIDYKEHRIVEGYAILQPRVAASLSSTTRSRYGRLFAGEVGIDPYTRSVSDVYQDLFGEGSYIGKGIYDVDAFQAVLDGRLPENWILSHDLLEGCHARSALVSDVQLFEEYPSIYTADVSRRHRWIRGDWQISPWLFPHLVRRISPGPGVSLSPLSRWKIFDNIRRSLFSPAMLLLLILGWLGFDFVALWISLALAVFFVPPFLQTLTQSLSKTPEVQLGTHLRGVFRAGMRRFALALISLAFLPHDAFVSLDAILRTLSRMFVTHRKLLEWRTARETELSARTDLPGLLLGMWFAPAVALGMAIPVFILHLASPFGAAPFLFLWAASPGLAWWLSRPYPEERMNLNEGQIAFLRKLARKTWAFFETYVGPEDNWLPPDNYQRAPVDAIAHRTSPTNIGLSLISNLAAYDFGYICAGTLIDRTTKSFETLEQLDRYRGHFLNWYDTRTLKPLYPKYVSTVDSGNLAGFILTLRPGLLEIAEHQIVSRRAFDGLSDTLLVISEAAQSSVGAARGATPPISELLAAITRLRSELRSSPRALTSSRMLLQRLSAQAGSWLMAGNSHLSPELGDWIRAFESQCKRQLDEITYLAPWLFLPASPERLWGRGTAEQLDRLAALREILRRLEMIPTLREVANLESDLLPLLDQVIRQVLDSNGETPREEKEWLLQLRQVISEAGNRATQRLYGLDRLMAKCSEFSDYDYGFLYDKSRNLMTIGYNASEHRRDTSYYDLLASEARLTSFIAIAEDQLPLEHWFAMGRLLTATDGKPALLSWGGSMFEYLMPLLIMPTYPGTLLDETYRAAVACQMKYGKDRGVAWGASESGYYLTDMNLHYQYRAFGVPGLGLKRGLSDDLVIAPYASALALMVAPKDACENLQRLAQEGIEGPYGFFEAVDYTPSRLTPGQKKAVVESFMAHHQGMALLSLAHVLLERPMQRRFSSDPLFQATDLLLQERVPHAASIFPHAAETSSANRPDAETHAEIRRYPNPNTPSPEVHLLSNGRYNVMVTNAGGGYSRWKDIAITRWHGDVTRDNWGQFCYARDTSTGEFWSISCQPTLRTSKTLEAVFPLARAEFRCRTNGIETFTEIAVSSEDDIELRRVSVTNQSKTARTLDLTSYAEIVLTSPAADAAHPAFSKLFIETELFRERQAILATRRPRSHYDPQPWMFHLMSVHGAPASDASYETDRLKFLGRGRTVADPEAMNEPGDLAGSAGFVLDPIVSIRRKVTIEPEATVVFDIVTGAADTREIAMELVERYQDRVLADRVSGLAFTHGQVVLRQLNASDIDAQLYERLAGSVLYPSSLRRASPAVLMRNRRGQSALWGYGISGDLPTVVLRLSDSSKMSLVRQMIQAHAYWRLKGLSVDLVILNEDQSGYRQALHDEVMGVIASGTEAGMVDRPGGIFVRRLDQMPEEDRILIESVARAIIVDSAGSLAEQLERRGRTGAAVPPFTQVERRGRSEPPARPQPARFGRVEYVHDTEAIRRELIFFNGIGGFTRDGREYVIRLPPGVTTPLPWSNVLANENFGTVISESGGAYTWAENAHEFRLTPWNNDPVSDASGEAFYIRDEESGIFWSPTPLPARGGMPYTTRHGFGYSVFEYEQNGIDSEMWVYVAPDAPVKLVRMKIRNVSGRWRKLSVTGFVEWVLGEHPAKCGMHVVTELDPKCGALFARNAYSNEFAERVAFFDVNEAAHTYSGDRTEFIGRNGTLAAPMAMSRARLSGKIGAGLDPCGALQVQFEISEGQEREIIFTLGAGKNTHEARALVQRFRGVQQAYQTLERVWDFWKRVLGAVYLETPDPATNVLANGWLLYQTWAGRFWGRSGYYQSGGAYGFRDQLQDVMALLWDPLESTCRHASLSIL